jgi:hypothetical protein
MTIDYNANRRFITSRLPRLVGNLPGRGKAIRGVFIHATRSGHSEGDDGPGTENWASNPSNTGAFWDALIYEDGQQVKCTNWEQDEQPLWAAGYGNSGTWSAQDNYIHIEFAQGTIDDEFTAAQLESGAQWIAEMARVHAFPVQRIAFLAQTGERPYGLADHENSANGRKLGKSDPGYRFPWAALIERITEINNPSRPEPENPGGDDVTREEYEALAARIYQLETQNWGEHPKVPRGTPEQPYADSTMFTLDQVAKIVPAIVRVLIGNKPQGYQGPSPVELLLAADQANKNLWDDHDDLNTAVRAVKEHIGMEL